MRINESNLKFRSLSYGNIPKSIVLHHAEAKECSIYDIHNWHLNNGWSGCGYHFLIRKDGSIWRGRPENTIGAHVSGFNTNSLGICAEGAYMTEIMPEVQKKALIELGIYLKKKYNINKIYGHREVGASNCPGTNYPLNEIRNAIFQTQPKIESYIKLDGGSKLIDDKPAINLIIRDFKNIDRIFAYVDNDKKASWAFDINPVNDNYIKLEKNCSKAINKRNEGYTFSPNSNYKIRVEGYKNGKIVTKNEIVLKTLDIKDNLYKVQVGAFRNKEYADNLQKELKDKGYNGFIKE